MDFGSRDFYKRDPMHIDFMGNLTSHLIGDFSFVSFSMNPHILINPGGASHTSNWSYKSDEPIQPIAKKKLLLF